MNKNSWLSGRLVTTNSHWPVGHGFEPGYCQFFSPPNSVTHRKYWRNVNNIRSNRQVVTTYSRWSECHRFVPDCCPNFFITQFCQQLQTSTNMCNDRRPSAREVMTYSQWPDGHGIEPDCCKFFPLPSSASHGNFLIFVWTEPLQTPFTVRSTVLVNCYSSHSPTSSHVRATSLTRYLITGSS